jgi:N6-adenosine-specific RNA methylase IME4/ParB-like chromosome segregation protein Spo0J
VFDEVVKSKNAAHANVCAVNAIKIGQRHRKDMGDIDGLARNISELGLLHPIVVNKDNTLVAGERRLEAVKQLGWRDIPVTVVNIADIARGEFAENMHRKDFTLSEAVAIKRALEPLEKAAAKERQREGGRRGGEGSGKLPEASKGNASDKAAKAAGIARRTLEKAQAIVDAAEADPEKFGKLKEEMDRTGRVDGCFKVLKRHEKHQQIATESRFAAQAKMEEGQFALIYADPPWSFDTYSEKGKNMTSPDNHYPTMSDEQIAALKIDGYLVPDIAAKDAVCFMWCTSANILRAAAIMEAWGFEYKSQAVWDKQRPATGYWFLNQHEVLLLGTRGQPPLPLKICPSVISAPRGKHSAKPIAVREMIEAMFPHFDKHSRIELFYRGAALDGWSVWGNQALDQAA